MWRSRKSYVLSALLCTSIPVVGFLCPTSIRAPTTNTSYQYGGAATQLRATDKNKNKDMTDDQSFATFFDRRKKKPESNEIAKSETRRSGILTSISGWMEGRKRKYKGLLEESNSKRKSGNQKDERKSLSIRQQKDEKSKTAFERERIRRLQADIKSDGNGFDRTAATDGESEWALKKINPVIAAQKLLSAVSNKQKASKEEWVVVASKTSIAPGALLPVSAAGLDLLLVASKDGSALHCIANSCPHLGTPLEIGTLERRPIEAAENEGKNANVAPSKLQGNKYLATLLAQDGCEDCIICPLHQTAFALGSGEVRGEWCPYPPVVGKVVGTIKPKSALPVFDVRTKGKNIEVRINTPIRVDGE